MPKVCKAKTSRFYVKDLVRELFELYRKVTFFSSVPNFGMERYDAPKGSRKTIIPITLPFVMWGKALPNLAPELREKWLKFMPIKWVSRRARDRHAFECISDLLPEASASHALETHRMETVEQLVNTQCEINADPNLEARSWSRFSQDYHSRFQVLIIRHDLGGA